MKYCWKTNPEQQSLLPPMVVLCAVLCISDIIGDTLNSGVSIWYTIIAIGITSVVLLFPALVAILSLRKYEIHTKGLTIYYPFGVQRNYSWSDFQEISLCKVHFASAAKRHIIAIRCSVLKEKKGPKQAVVARGRWATIEYEVIHWGKIITIYYTDERYNEFMSVCPFTITDYQHLEDI